MSLNGAEMEMDWKWTGRTLKVESHRKILVEEQHS